MDSFSFNQNLPETLKEKKHLSLPFIIFFEILFVGVFFSAIFIALNYLNIIHLSYFFSEKTALRTINSNTPENNKKILTSYLRQILASNYYPPYVFSASESAAAVHLSWQENNFEFVVIRQFMPSPKQGNIDLVIRSAPKENSFLKIQPNSLDASLSANISSTFFKNLPDAPWICERTTKRIFCQKTVKIPNAKISIGIRQNISVPQALSVYACVVEPSNLFYNVSDSCL